MKKFNKRNYILLLGLAFSSSAFAGFSDWFSFDNGWYLGAQGGYSESNYTARNQGFVTFAGVPLGPASVKTSENNIGGRIYTGQQFNKYIAAELGMAVYSEVDLKNIYGVSGAKMKIRPQVGDLVAKLSLPFWEHYNIYTKWGGAYVYLVQDPNSTAKAITTPGGTPLGLKKTHDSKVRATYGFGTSYKVNECMTYDFSWARIQGGAGFKKTTLSAVSFNYFIDCDEF